jgi:hypothetical protein
VSLVGDDARGEVAGMFQTVRQAADAIGTTLIANVIVGQVSAGSSPGASQIAVGYLTSAAVGGFGAILAFRLVQPPGTK